MLTRKTLLIIDDDRFFCQSLSNFLSNKEYEVISVHSKNDGEQLCRKRKIDVVLLDQKLPDGNGIDLCNTLLKSHEQIKIIFITAFPSFDNAVKALRKGAYDYLSKPLEIEEVAMVVDQAFRTLELENVEQIQEYKNRQENNENILIGKNGGLAETYTLIQLAAINDVPVLITGETGTGKSVVAKAIHYYKGNNSDCFMAINCAALPENLIEAELFGHEKGAFTGAATSKKGIFELADGGTLFLDEIGELPLHLQSKLLGVLDDKTIRRIGGQSFRKISTRIISATNVNLEEAINRNVFRQDLFYRLGVLRIHLPPLRQRRDDIGPLCHHFLRSIPNYREIHLPKEEIDNLEKYGWPGNVRELKNVIERAIILQRNNTIYPSKLLETSMVNPVVSQPYTSQVPLTLAEVEQHHIEKTLELLNHNHTKTAQALGISRSTLIRKLKSLSKPQTVSN